MIENFNIIKKTCFYNIYVKNTYFHLNFIYNLFKIIGVHGTIFSAGHAPSWRTNSGHYLDKNGEKAYEQHVLIIFGDNDVQWIECCFSVHVTMRMRREYCFSGHDTGVVSRTFAVAVVDNRCMRIRSKQRERPLFDQVSPLSSPSSPYSLLLELPLG